MISRSGAILGSEMVIVRILSALAMAFVVGWVMSFVFRREEAQKAGGRLRCISSLCGL